MTRIAVVELIWYDKQETKETIKVNFDRNRIATATYQCLIVEDLRVWSSSFLKYCGR